MSDTREGTQSTPRTHEWGAPLWMDRMVMDAKGVYRATKARICQRCGRSDLAARAFGWNTCNGGPDAER